MLSRLRADAPAFVPQCTTKIDVIDVQPTAAAVLTPKTVLRADAPEFVPLPPSDYDSMSFPRTPDTPTISMTLNAFDLATEMSYATPAMAPSNLKYDRSFLLAFRYVCPSLLDLPKLPCVVELIGSEDEGATPSASYSPKSRKSNHSTPSTPSSKKQQPLARIRAFNNVPPSPSGRRKKSPTSHTYAPPPPPTLVLEDVKPLSRSDNRWERPRSTKAEEAILRRGKGILNKLTYEKMEPLRVQLLELIIANGECECSLELLKGLVALIFDKAVTEPSFSTMYAELCVFLCDKLPEFQVNGRNENFRRLLLNKCQAEFEKGAPSKEELDEKLKGLDDAERLIQEVKIKRAMLGNIRLIGELFKLRLLSEPIIRECNLRLLGSIDQPDEEHIEALCQLLTTVGKILDNLQSKRFVDKLFGDIYTLRSSELLSSRIRFMLQDLSDLRLNKWIPRRDVAAPKTLQELHEEAEREERSKQLERTKSLRLPSTPKHVPPSSTQQATTVSKGKPPPLKLAAPSTPRRAIVSSPTNEWKAVSKTSLTVKVTSDSLPALTASYAALSKAVHSDDSFIPVNDHEFDDVSTPLSLVANTRTSSSSSMTEDETGHSPYSLSSSPSVLSPVSIDEDRLQGQMNALLEEFFSSWDMEEACRCVHETFGSSEQTLSAFVHQALVACMERKQQDRRLLVSLFESLLEEGTLLSTCHIASGLAGMVLLLADMLVDVPMAVEIYGEYVGLLAARQCVPVEALGNVLPVDIRLKAIPAVCMAMTEELGEKFLTQDTPDAW
eukprot:CAMPEP_0184655708 /NCGR_PEP_ID=MMETSP0308-20130426/14359_1 /TAXON_ID=38269 /ORGANISM="Gloeochaete witrockiana, Strain SAG 46.84" /LENGTH=780 /DNA_ID=CAMNT_0027092407 /DNA_START=229 /DNA_END=2568 /DNA_ORIENTATION=+